MSVSAPATTAPPHPIARLLVPLGALVCLVPGVPAAAALVGGVVLALGVGNPHVARTRKLTHPLLMGSVVGLGAGMDLQSVLRVGAHGLGATAAGIATCLLVGALLTRLFGVGRTTGLLISVGTAICGGSAIAAAAPVLRAKDDEVSVALATVFLLNAFALVTFPVVGHALALTQDAFGLWSALAIHDTSSVVGAALQYGPRALEVATTAKLARALWIIPLTVALAVWQARRVGAAEGTTRPARPWFIGGFLIAAALVTWIPALQPAGHVVAAGARQVLVLTLFLVGANLSRAALRSVGVRPLAQGVLLWAVMASASLAWVRWGVPG
ncbi:MAG: putative sulfate exporter family transporter [Myxococcaceae bacterium]|nr:putative sulfate exporter family transporter [Myxococcaceae bacterium]